MTASGTIQHPSDARLWWIAGLLSLLLNLGILSFVGLAVIESQQRRAAIPAAPPTETSVWIYPDAMPKAAIEPAPASASRPFARTSPDQEAPPQTSARWMGERDTAATSDRAPDAEAPELPSQSGVEPRFKGDIETTESDYQDGELDASASSPAAAEPALPSPPPSVTSVDPSPAPPAASPAEELYSGTNPVEIPIPEPSPLAATPPASETLDLQPETAVPPAPETDLKPTPQAPAAPTPEKSFRGYQRKTAIVGSISRTGPSSLDVENTPFGRYQAAVSRAVELEWQRNCVRHRDFITPGYLTARFFVDPSGKVRSVQFLGEMQTGEIQKGFTLNSIRDARIPAMPAAVKKELNREPLELVFRFFF